MTAARDTAAVQRDLLDQKLRVQEQQAAEALDVIRQSRDEWESYGVQMREHARRIDEASAGDDPKNYFVQRRLAARGELDEYVGRLVREQAEMLDEAEREVSVSSEDESDRLRREKAGASWD